MPDTLDFSFQIRETTIRVLYGDVTRIAAEAFVSSDDGYLSGASGLSKAIRNAGGQRLQDDIDKLQRPKPMGSVVVTSAGLLQAQYVLHAVTISFGEQPFFDTLIPQIIGRILVICNALGVTSLAMPMVNAGLVNVPPASMLAVLCRSAACFLARSSSTVRQITLAVYDAAAEDQAAAEAQMLVEMADTIDRILSWAMQTPPLNRQILPLVAAIEVMPDAPELRQQVEARIGQLEDQLLDVFGSSGTPDAAPELYGAISRVGAFSDRSAYEKGRDRLDKIVADFEDLLVTATDTLKKYRRNLGLLENAEANYGGIDVPLEILNNIDAVKAQITQKEQAVAQLQQQRDHAKGQLDALNATWQGRG